MWSFSKTITLINKHNEISNEHYAWFFHVIVFIQNVMLRMVTEIGISQTCHNRQIRSLLQFQCLIRTLLQGCSLVRACWKSLGVCKSCSLFRRMISINRRYGYSHLFHKPWKNIHIHWEIYGIYFPYLGIVSDF